MAENQNMHKTKLGWYVWFENTNNQYQMMLKSMSLIFMAGLIATFLAEFISTHIGLWDTKLSIDFYLKFVGLFFKSIFNPELRSLRESSIDAILHEQLIMFLVHSPVGIYVSYLIFLKTKKLTSEMAETSYIKGTKIVPEEVRVKELNQKIKSGKLHSRLHIGRIPLPVEVETNHVLVNAASGAGKTVLLKKVMQKVMRLRHTKGIVHDIKPDWILICYRPDRGDMIFNPMDVRSIKWTVWNDIHDIMDIKNFAMWIVPDNPAAKDPFWQTSAREILESIMIYLWERDETTNEAIRKMIGLSSEELSEKLVGLSGADYAAKKDSLSTLKSQMQWVYFLPDGDFSIGRWINEAPRGLLFLSNTEKTQALFKPVLSLFVNAVGSYVLNLPDDRNRRFFFFLDEFTALMRLDKVIELLKLGRSKGVSIWMAFQDFQQLEKIYSREDMKTIINNCKNVAIGQLQEPDAAKYLASRFGKQEFYEKSQTFSMGVADNRDGMSLNEQRKEDFVVKDTDLLNLKEREFYVKINELEGVTKTIADIIQVEQIAEGFIPVRMTKEQQLSIMYADRSSKNGARNTAKDQGLDSSDSFIEKDLDDEFTI